MSFAVHVLTALFYWTDPDRGPLAARMTVGYVARCCDLHGPDIDALAGLPGPEESGTVASGP